MAEGIGIEYDELVGNDEVLAMDRLMRILATRIVRDETESRDLKSLAIEYKATRERLRQARVEAASEIGKPLATVTSLAAAADGLRDAI